MTGPTSELAHFISQTVAADLPSEVIKQAKAFILDNAAVALVGSTQAVYASTLEAVLSASGTGDTPLIGSEAQVCLSASTFLNGVAIGDFEYEHVGSNAHPAASVFPTALALTARLGRSGRDMITAMSLGYEVAARLGRASTVAVESERGFHNPGLNGTFGAAAAASWLLELSPERTAWALGLAGSSSAGLMAFSSTGTMTKRLHPGRSGQLGLESALLARAGVSGPPDVLENPEGFLKAFSPNPEPHHLTRDLGSEWVGTQMLIKLAPAHGYAQHFVHAINCLYADKPRPKAADIQAVHISAGSHPQKARHLQTRPATLVEAQYSVVFCIAVSLLHDLTDPLVFNDSLIADQDVIDVAERITFTLDDTSHDGHGRGGVVTLYTSEGEERLDATGYPGLDGIAQTWDIVRAKFDRAIESIIGTDQRQDILRAVEDLDSADGTHELMQHLRKPSMG